MKRIVLLGSALVAVAVALSIHLVTAGGTAAHSGRVVIHHTPGLSRGPIVRGRSLSGLARRGITLASAAAAPLVGNLGPVAAPSRAGRYLAYNTWKWARSIDWQRSLEEQGISTGDPLGRPQLRIRDLRTADETAFEPGSFSVAWRADGAIAYARGTIPDDRANTAFLADVVVRRDVDAEPVTWSVAPDRYLVEGWAGRRLIVRRQVSGETGELLGRDRRRERRAHAATECSLDRGRRWTRGGTARSRPDRRPDDASSGRRRRRHRQLARRASRGCGLDRPGHLPRRRTTPFGRASPARGLSHEARRRLLRAAAH